MPNKNIFNPISANKDFMSYMKKPSVLCLYYWNNCGHCHSFIPVWKELIKKYSNKNINLISIELDAIKELKDEYKIYAFPTLVLFKNGKKELEYNGNRDIVSLTQFIETKMKQPTNKHAKVIKPSKKPYIAKKHI